MCSRVNRSKILILVSTLMMCVFFIIITLDHYKERNYQEEFYNSKIDSLNHSIDSLENCINLIKPRIDTIYQQKTLIKYLYNEKADTIWNQSADDDWKYYTNFLSTRFPSDTCPTKTN